MPRRRQFLQQIHAARALTMVVGPPVARAYRSGIQIVEKHLHACAEEHEGQAQQEHIGLQTAPLECR